MSSDNNKQLLESFLVGSDSNINLLSSPTPKDNNSPNELERKIAKAMSGTFHLDDFNNNFNDNSSNIPKKDEVSKSPTKSLSGTKAPTLSHSSSSESINKKVTINAPLKGAGDPVNTVAKKGTYTPQPRRVPATSLNNSPIQTLSPLNTPVGFGSMTGSELSELTGDGWSLRKRSAEHSFEKPTVKVAVRVRPFTVAEVQSSARRIISFNGNKLVIVNPNAFDADPDTIAAAAAAVHCKEWAQVFKFNHCLWSYDPDDVEDDYVNQEGVYRTVGSEIVENVLNGISASCFSYGHTSTGKTHAMFGTIDPALISTKVENNDLSFITSASSLSENCGLIPRVFTDIIEGLKRQDDSSKDTKITISFIEIYNERIRDLLAPKNVLDQELRVREHPVIGPYVEGLTKIPVDSAHHALQLIYSGHAKRETASTAFNHQSSRSHAVVTLELTPIDADPQVSKSFSPISSKSRTSLDRSSKDKNKDFETNCVRVQMVDLAGSEKDCIHGYRGRREDEELDTLSTTKKAQGVNLSYNPRIIDPNAEKTEMKLIRQSLSTLGYIIKSLAVGTPFKSLPYRDSVLTWILRDALNGRNHTTMLATLSPSHIYYDESLSTLKYAERLSLVGHKVGFSDPFLSIRKTPTQQKGDNDFSKIHEALGANKPGTPAARQLLRQTINDPQQRIAKMNSSKQVDVMPTKDFENSVIAALEAESTNSEKPAYEDLRDTYRVLYNKFIELQIELENARADRDSMLIELQSVKDSHDATNNLSSSSTKTTISDLSMALKLSEKEIVELRSLIKRKEDQIERLLADISDEKRSRMGTEEAVHAQANEFIMRVDALQRENKEYSIELDKARADVAIAKQDRNSLKAEVESLKSIYIGEIETLKNMYQKDVEVLKKGLVNAKDNFQEELRKADEFNAKLSAEANESKTSQLAAEKIAREMIRTIERMKSEVGALTLERDSLLGIIDRQEAAIKLQHQQSEASLKMLHQRQAALERVESDAATNMDELVRLQEGLEGMLTREGSALHSELLDAKRLTEIISTLRERMNESTILNEELVKERAIRINLESRYSSVEAELNKLRSSLPTGGFQQINDKVSELEQQLKTKEALATYWQQVAENVNASVESSSSMELKAQNVGLQEQLTASKAETIKTKEELNAAKENMQTEFASLWMAVQELNKLDASKDHELKNLIEERDKAVREKQISIDNYRDLQQKYSAVQLELTEVDKYLVEALGVNINRNILRSSTERLQHAGYINSYVSSHNNVNRNTPQSSRVVPRTPQSNGPKSIHQQVLENQLLQLNEFLDEDKNKLRVQNRKIKDRVSSRR